MTANHAHTPTMDQIRDDFIEAWSGHFMDGDKGATEYFDQALRTHNATIEAAAEQRGAIKALRDAAGAIEKNQIMTQVGHLQPCNSCMVIHMDFLDYRADRLEGDDE